MKIITIKTQKQFNKLPNSFKEFTIIEIRNTEGVIIIDRAWGNSSVEARDNSSVEARHNSSVKAWDNSSVKARDNSFVEAWDNSSVEAWGNSSVEAWGNSSVIAGGNSFVEARDNSSVIAGGNSFVEARDNSSVKAWDNSSVEAWDNSSVIAGGNSFVEAWDNSSVKARDNSSVEAWGNACCWAMSEDCTITLFSFAICYKLTKAKVQKKSETATIIEPKYKKGIDAWLERHGIKPKQKVILYKKVSKDFETQEGTDRKTIWKIGETLKHKNWKPEENECGEDKFHACARPFFCDEFRNEKGDKYIAIEIAKKDLYVWDKNPNYPHKVAFRRGKVLYECDKLGNKL